MLRARYWISPAGERWSVSREDRVLARYEDQECAIGAVVALARDDSPSELYITDPDGEIQEHRSFDVSLVDDPPLESGETFGFEDEGERFPVLRRSEHEATMIVAGDLAHHAWLVQLTRVILDLLEDPQLDRLIVDMSGVTHFDVQSVAGWVGLERFVRENNRTLAIVNASPSVREVLARMSIVS